MPRKSQPLSAATRLRAPIASRVGEELLSSSWLRRLRNISFLGTLDAHPESAAASSRWEHSLGVAALGLRAADDLGLDESMTRHLVAACMLHDVGHFPFSHAAEAAFARRVGGNNHHAVGRWLVLGDGPIPHERSLAPLLRRAALDPEAVWAIIDPKGPPHPARALGPLLSAAINLDTLDGIARVARTFKRRRETSPPPAIFARQDDELFLRAEALPFLDRFWRTKDAVYDQIINLPSNILAEARLCDAVLEAFEHIVADDLLALDDAALREALHATYSKITIDVRHDEDFMLRDQAGWGKLVIRNRKRYVVDDEVRPDAAGLPVAAWSLRYRHTKAPAYLVARRRQLELPGLLTLELERPEL